MRWGAAIVAAIAAGALAAGAGGRSAKVIELPLHGTAILTGSHIRCGSATLQGSAYVDCSVANPRNLGEPKPGGYLVFMAANGRVSVLATTSNKAVFSRAPAAVHRRLAGIPVAVGDVIRIPKTRISCTVSRVGGKPSALCYLLDAKGSVRPRSYSFGINDTILTLFSWDAAGKPHVIRSWSENG
jgi:hypothetical protein